MCRKATHRGTMKSRYDVELVREASVWLSRRVRWITSGAPVIQGCWRAYNSVSDHKVTICNNLQ